MTRKKKLILRGPVTTASGYGVHARQVLGALLSSGEYDVSVQATRWGETSFLYPGDVAGMERIYDLVRKHEAERRAGIQYDVSVQVTIPNEFQKMAAVNVGVTAGIEVDRVSPEWIVKANENVDLLVVPSVHSAETFANVQYQDQNGGTLRLTRPVAVIPEGVDVSIFNTDPVEDLVGLDLPAEFNFLTVGLGLDRPVGEDRKNIAALVKWFCERFRDDPGVGLVLKVGLVGSSILDHNIVERRLRELKRAAGCGDLPRLHLVHGRISDPQMASLYKHPRIGAYVTLTHGEGFGLPIIEAAACGLPVLAPAWSGHVDFLTVDGRRKFVPLEHDLAEIPKSAVWKGVMEEGTRWACVREDDVKSKMKKVVLSPAKPREWAAELARHVAGTFSVSRTNGIFVEVLRSFLAQGDAPARTHRDVSVAVRERLGIGAGERTLLYTMPMSAGDVLDSTAVVDSLRRKHPEHRIIFATQPRYAGLLKGNPDISAVVEYEDWMRDVPFCEGVFDEVYTPNLAIQTLQSNWIRGGKGRRLAEEMAAQCQVELGQYRIPVEDPGVTLPSRFVAFHPGSGQGQWEARDYRRWQEVVSNISELSGLPVVQLGLPEDPAYTSVIDMRGATPSYGNLAYVISKCSLLVGIDSVTMHMAAAVDVPHIALFGSSYPGSTGPVTRGKSLSVLMETPSRLGCEKACYKYQCVVDRWRPCINEIDPRQVVLNAISYLEITRPGADPDTEFRRIEDAMSRYREVRPTVSGYTHVLNAETHGYPFVESVRSMLGFCDEVVVVDGGSTDGTLDRIREIGDERIKVYHREWDWSEPGMDGMQKAYGRAMCVGDFLWQQDADEVVHEDDYDKVRRLVERFPRNVDLVHLPIVELWGDATTVRCDRQAWKWRLSRNSFRITHGIHRDARVVDRATGRTFAKKGLSDGCEFIDIMTGETVQHGGFYTRDLEVARQTDPVSWGESMNQAFSELPCVFHYSWVGLERKIRHFKSTWNRLWSNLYNDPSPVDRFPDVDESDPQSVSRKAEELRSRGGEHGPAPTFRLARTGPALMEGWLKNAR